MKTLTLQITAGNFESILKGEQKIETRRCDSLMLIKRHYFENENGELDLIPYEALKLINGRKKDAPELLVKVTGIGWCDYRDENDEPITLEDVKTGEEIIITDVEYDLGEIIEYKNCEKFLN